jgi:hypothetical protein
MSSSDNEIGYGKPPKHTRFKKGQSGNPKGRPKGVKNFTTDLREELQERIVVREGPNTFRISKQRAIIKTLTAKTLKGDSRALTTVINVIVRLLLDPADHAGAEELLNEEERELYAAFIDEVQRKALPTSNTEENRKQEENKP